MQIVFICFISHLHCTIIIIVIQVFICIVWLCFHHPMLMLHLQASVDTRTKDIERHTPKVTLYIPSRYAFLSGSKRFLLATSIAILSLLEASRRKSFSTLQAFYFFSFFALLDTSRSCGSVSALYTIGVCPFLRSGSAAPGL